MRPSPRNNRDNEWITAICPTAPLRRALDDESEQEDVKAGRFPVFPPAVNLSKLPEDS